MISETKIEQLSEKPQEILEDARAPATSRQPTVREDVSPSSKIIAREIVDLEILYFLSLGPKSGYELKKNLMKSFRLNLSYGTLYPHLHALEKADLIAGSWKMQNDSEPLRKRMYALTDSGTVWLNDSIATLSKIALTMQFILSKLSFSPTQESPLSKEMIETAKEIYKVQGYTAVVGAKLKGASGIEHSTDVAATRGGGKERILIKLSNKGDTVDDVLRTCVVSNDLHATETIMICTCEIADEVTRLAKSCGITLYSCKDAAEVATKLTADLVAKQAAKPQLQQVPA
jgi:DNA-binding PadR family transcriptional regulator